jgi:hypothetical protein
MADQKISELTALTGANVADTDLLPIVDTSATETKKITFGEFKTALDTATGFVRITGDTMTGNLIVNANVGIGVTPSAWNTFTGSLQIDGASLSGLGANNTALGSNTYYSSGWKYYGTGSASLYQQNAGQHTWSVAPSGTAGNAITFTQALTIDSSGNVGIANTVMSSMNSGARNLVIGSGSTGQGMTIYSSTTTAGSIHFADGTVGDAAYRGQLVYNHNGDYMAMLTAATERLRIDSLGGLITNPAAGGHAVFNESGVDADFRVESDTNAYAFFVEGSSGNVGIGSTSSATSRAVITDDGAVNDRLLFLDSSAGLGGGQAGPFYGLYSDITGNNNSTAVYGAYLNATPASGACYGVFAESTQDESGRDSIAIYGNATVNSATVNHRPNRALGAGPVAGVYATASTTGTSMSAETTALYALNASVYGSEAYGAWIETTAGPTTVVPLKVVHAGSELMRIDSSGAVTMPAQPAFSAVPTAAQLDIAINTEVTVVFGTEVFDVGANFASNTFTAPVTGKYQLNVSIYVNNLDTGADYYQVSLKTSNRTYQNVIDPGVLASDPVYWTQTLSILADMDASDTAYIFFQQGNGTAQTDITSQSRFSGFLAC